MIANIILISPSFSTCGITGNKSGLAVTSSADTCKNCAKSGKGLEFCTNEAFML